MGKRGPRKKGVSGVAPSSGSVTLREVSIGKKKHTHVNAKSMLKLDHIMDLAFWASSEASIPSLGAFFGQRLASSAEALGVPPEPSLFTCQRCETILHAGDNCTIRIEKNKKKARNRRKKPGISPQNYIVCECHFCSHRNVKRGTPKGYMKGLYPTKPPTLRVHPTKSAIQKSEQLDTSVVSINGAEPASREDPTRSVIQYTSVASIDGDDNKAEPASREDPTKSVIQYTLVASIDGDDNKTDAVVSSEIVGDDPNAATPATPLSTRTVTSLLDSKRKKRNRPSSKKTVEPETSASTTDAEKTIPTSSKRKRKSWTSLKEIAEGEGSGVKKFSNLSVPFSI